MKEETKRVFFGIEVHAPWPEILPIGRLLDSTHRHITLAFLGNVSWPPLLSALASFPPPSFHVGFTGSFDACLLLPPRHPSVVAWHTKWEEESSGIVTFQQTLTAWLKGLHYRTEEREWLPHTTISRKPFDPHAWKKTFVPLPFYASSIHLYESMGNLTYIPLWSHPIDSPFEEIDHTADMAFIIRGETIPQLYHHAFTALAFKCPELLKCYTVPETVTGVDDIVIGLNEIVGLADSTVGSPFKAVSFHGEIQSNHNGILEWEMIVDV